MQFSCQDFKMLINLVQVYICIRFNHDSMGILYIILNKIPIEFILNLSLIYKNLFLKLQKPDLFCDYLLYIHQLLDIHNFHFQNIFLFKYIKH